MNDYEVILVLVFSYFFLWLAVLVLGSLMVCCEQFITSDPDGIKNTSRFARTIFIIGVIAPVLAIILPFLILYLLSPLPEIRERMRRKTQ